MSDALGIARAAYRDIELYARRRRARWTSATTRPVGVPPRRERAPARRVANGDALPSLYAPSLRTRSRRTRRRARHDRHGCGSATCSTRRSAPCGAGRPRRRPDPSFAMIRSRAMNGLEPVLVRRERQPTGRDAMLATGARVPPLLAEQPDRQPARADAVRSVGARGARRSDRGRGYAEFAERTRSTCCARAPRCSSAARCRRRSSRGLRVGYMVGARRSSRGGESRGPYKVNGSPTGGARRARRTWRGCAGRRTRRSRTASAGGRAARARALAFRRRPTSCSCRSRRRLRSRADARARVAVRRSPARGIGDALRISVGPWEMGSARGTGSGASGPRPRLSANRAERREREPGAPGEPRITSPVRLRRGQPALAREALRAGRDGRVEPTRCARSTPTCSCFPRRRVRRGGGAARARATRCATRSSGGCRASASASACAPVRRERRGRGRRLGVVPGRVEKLHARRSRRSGGRDRGGARPAVRTARRSTSRTTRTATSADRRTRGGDRLEHARGHRFAAAVRAGTPSRAVPPEKSPRPASRSCARPCAPPCGDAMIAIPAWTCARGRSAARRRSVRRGARAARRSRRGGARVDARRLPCAARRTSTRRPARLERGGDRGDHPEQRDVVQVGGGVRSEERIEALLELGAARVVVGTRALEDADWLAEMAERFPGVLVVAADVKGRQIVTRGWERTLPRDVIDVVEEIGRLPIAAAMVTAVHRGAMQARLVPRRGRRRGVAVPVLASAASARCRPRRARGARRGGVVMGWRL